MTIGKRLLSIRKEHKLSQSSFGEICEVTKAMVSQWENDELIPPTPRLLKLQQEFKFSLDWLILGKNDYSSALKEPLKSQFKITEPPPNDEVELLLGYRAAVPQIRDAMLNMAREASKNLSFQQRSETQ
ncbi:helix-turn-helix domain-containing protein [Malikia spinosa]|uniref:helix-turn-helix domain-containing protein n=1 Tax=Malikia spinosa TaxID=86180 RepID=UPI002FDA80D5